MKLRTLTSLCVVFIYHTSGNEQSTHNAPLMGACSVTIVSSCRNEYEIWQVISYQQLRWLDSKADVEVVCET